MLPKHRNKPKTYSKAFKRGFLRVYEEEKDIMNACEAYGISRDTFYGWVQKTPGYAEEYFKIRDSIYEDVKIRVLETYMECGSITRACKIEEVSQAQFYNWIYRSEDFKNSYIIAKQLTRDRLYDHAVTKALEGNNHLLMWLIDKLERGEQAALDRGHQVYSVSDYATDVETVQDIEARVIELASRTEDKDRKGNGKDGPVLPAEIPAKQKRH